MKKQKLFKTFKCIYVPDCFVVNRFIFLETSPESSGVKSAYDPEVQNLEKLQGELPPAINVEITQAIKDFKDAKRLVETYTKQLKDLQSGHDDYATKARIRTTKQYLEDSKNKLQDAEKKLDEVIDKHSESIKVAETAAKLMRKEERRLKIAELYKAEEAARLAAIPLPTAASGAGAATGEPAPAKPTTAAPKVKPTAAPAQAPAPPAAPAASEQPAAPLAAAPGAKKPPEKPADWTPEQKFQRMMDRYVGDGDNFLISKEDFAKALNYAKGTPTVFTATNVSEIRNAATVVNTVKLLQEKLNSEKNAGLEVDGIFGRKTNAAYRKEQQPAAAPAEPRPAEKEPEKQPESPPATAPEVKTPKPEPEAPKNPLLSLPDKFDLDKFYSVKNTSSDAARADFQGKEIKPGDFVYPIDTKQNVWEVFKSDGTKIKIHKDYLASSKGNNLDQNKMKELAVNVYKKTHELAINKTDVRRLDGNLVCIIPGNAGVGAVNVLNAEGKEIQNVSMSDLQEVNVKQQNDYIIARYENLWTDETNKNVANTLVAPTV